MKKILCGLIMATAIMGPLVARAEQPTVSWSSGVDYTSGKYTDTRKTKILYVPFTGTVTADGFEAGLTVPYISIKGPGTVIGGGDIGPISRARAPRTISTQSGLGDVIASLGWTSYAQNNTLFVTLSGKAKLPTASRRKTLGTGKTDFTAQMDLSKVAGPVNLFATAGYRFMGSSTALPLRNGFVGSLGASVNATRGTSVGLIYDYRRSAAPSASNPSELTGFISWALSERVRLQTYGVVGFSNGSPDSGIGLQITLHP